MSVQRQKHDLDFKRNAVLLTGNPGWTVKEKRIKELEKKLKNATMERNI